MHGRLIRRPIDKPEPVRIFFASFEDSRDATGDKLALANPNQAGHGRRAENQQEKQDDRKLGKKQRR